jgi:UDP-N-acetyl-D-glucosamine dehydrogenase
MLGYEARFIAFADEINSGMPAYTVQLAADALNDQGKPLKGSRVLALGVAYKPGVGDVRDSPAIEIIDALLLRGARVDYSDPHVPALTVRNRRLEGEHWTRNLTGPLGAQPHVIRL